MVSRCMQSEEHLLLMRIMDFLLNPKSVQLPLVQPKASDNYLFSPGESKAKGIMLRVLNTYH